MIDRGGSSIQSKGTWMMSHGWIFAMVVVIAGALVVDDARQAAFCSAYAAEFSGFERNWDAADRGEDLDWFDDATPGDCGCNADSSATWRLTTSALFLHRSRPAAADLVRDAFDNTSILQAQDFDLGFHTGLDVSASRRIGERFGIEARYFGIDHWSAATESATTPGSLLLWTTSPGVAVWAGTGIEAAHASELHNVEVNGQYRWCEGWTLLAGFRYVELDERFTANLIDPPVPFTYQAATRNRLYGAQLGTTAVLWDRGGPFTVHGAAKVGIFGNAAAQDSVYRTDFPSLTASGDRSPVAFLGELGVAADYRLSERWSLQLGYQLLWIDQVALATEQIAASNFVTGQGIDATGDTFYHGANVGLQFVW
jgi:hypothetical protein